MKKILLSVVGAGLALTACMSNDNGYNGNGTPPAYYTDWDRAVRVDVDMQNMYVGTPQKIEKPIDMYMAMALALKYNYTRRLISYQQSLIEAGKVPTDKLSEIASHAGYDNATLNTRMSPDLKVAWNVLDISTVYYQNIDPTYKNGVATEQSRKVIHNILQETRSLYWQSLAAQKLIPVIDDMTEYMTLEVDEMNARAKELAEQGKYLTTEELQKKRDYMEAVKKASDLRRKMETAETRLASLMGFHPSTEFKLVGSEYGNFELPALKNELAQLEWLALTNRPEMRAHDLSANVEDLKIVVKGFKEPELNKYKNDPNYYNRLWSKQAQQVSMTVMEDVRNPKISELNDLRRQRMTNLIISQVYVAWARYTSAVEDYQINMEIADTSENIAEDITIKDGSGNSKSILESARAVDDEVQAFLAYAEVQDALGNLYATIGLDAIPYYMLNDKPSKIAVALHKTLEKWREGEFIPDNRPYLLDVPAKRPPVNMSSLIPDYEVETGQRIKIDVPSAVFDKMELVGKITTKAGLIDDSPLPKWLNYDEKNHRFEGIAMPSNVGQYNIKLYVTDENGNVGYLTFKLKIKEVFVPSMRVDGLTDGRKATVLKRCLSSVCKDTYVDDEAVGEEVEVRVPARF